MLRAAATIALHAWSAAIAGAQDPVLPTEAEHAVIMDYETDEILFSKNGTTPMIPASMTKIMTAYVVFDR